MKSTQTYRVLIVEDDRWSRELMLELVAMRPELTLGGLAESGVMAVDIVRRGRDAGEPPFDLFLLDINLPGMSGIEFLEALEDIPFVIFTTAYEQYAVKAFEIGAVDYLLKPIEHARFDRAIDRFIAIHEERIPFDVYHAIEEMKEGEKYRKSTLADDRAAEYAGRILRHMEEDRAYVDEDLTLQKMARDLNIPPHHLSQVLNTKLHRNFYHFINEYRIEEAKRLLMLHENRDLTILELSQQAGFKSKSVFNAVFREFTGMTPKDYRNAPKER